MIRVEIEWKEVMGSRKRKRKVNKEQVAEQTEMGRVCQTDEWEGV